jgi:hypothetical protein
MPILQSAPKAGSHTIVVKPLKLTKKAGSSDDQIQIADNSEPNFNPFGDESPPSDNSMELFDFPQPRSSYVNFRDCCGNSVSTITASETVNTYDSKRKSKARGSEGC